MPQGKHKLKSGAAKKKAGRPNKKSGRITKAVKAKKGAKAKGHLKKVQLALEKAIREDIETSTRAKATTAEGRSMNTGGSTSKGSKSKKN